MIGIRRDRGTEKKVELDDEQEQNWTSTNWHSRGQVSPLQLSYVS